MRRSCSWWKQAGPYLSAAVGAYGVAVLTRAEDTAADATVNMGRRILQALWRRRDEAGRTALEEAVTQAAEEAQDPDTAAALRRQLKRALRNDPALCAELVALLPAPTPGTLSITAAGTRSIAAHTIGTAITGDGHPTPVTPEEPTPDARIRATGDRNIVAQNINCAITGDVHLPAGVQHALDKVQSAPGTSNLAPVGLCLWREEELACLRRTLTEKRQGAITQTGTVHGLGGVGKSTLSPTPTGRPGIWAVPSRCMRRPSLSASGCSATCTPTRWPAAIISPTPAGDPGRAIPLLEATLAKYEQVLGDAHPDTLKARNNLAGAYCMAGDLGRAVPMYEATIAQCMRVLGDTHPLTSMVQENVRAAIESARRPPAEHSPS